MEKGKIHELENKIENLQNEIDFLKRSIHRLATVAMKESKYPYWNKLLCLGIPEDKKNKFEFALSLLTDRLEGIKIIVKDDNEINDELFESNDTIILKSKAENVPQKLLVNSIPIWNDVSESLCSILNIWHVQIIEEILISMREQEMFVSLINHFLPKEV
ncbi:MAG: hypothetical protein AB6733_03010 [Clostridiaceae bacterium]